MSTATATLPAIKYSTFINAPVEKVYKTLTTADGWNAWFTKATTIDLRVGGAIEFVWRDWAVDHVDFEDGGEILEVEQSRKFSFTWHRAYSPTTVTFSLRKLGDGTVVDLTDSGYKFEDLSNEFCGFAVCCSGWGEALTLLKVYIEHGITYGKVPKN
jgi:uncharacterized protein YndB with AHSA1/START domain